MKKCEPFSITKKQGKDKRNKTKIKKTHARVSTNKKKRKKKTMDVDSFQKETKKKIEKGNKNDCLVVTFLFVVPQNRNRII